MLLGREDELGTIRGLAAAVGAGRGGVLLVEGEPGIGRSSLLRAGLAEAAGHGVQVRSAAAGELGLPLRALLNCFDAGERGEVSVGASLPACIERMLALVDRLCGAGPLALVLDDLQWADDASLAVWNQLARAVDRLPLLLVAAARPVPRRPEVAALRRGLRALGTVTMVLDPLPPARAAELAGALAGGAAGPRLAGYAAQAGGNPRYICELVDALRREGRIRVAAGGAAGRTVELTDEACAVPAPASLGTAIAERLGFLTASTNRILRVAALLGKEFSVVDLAVVTGHAPTALMAAVDEAIVAGVLRPDGAALAFRHPVVRTALYDVTPPGVRAALHRQAARALAAAGGAVERVAGHLLATAPHTVDEWTLDWLRREVSRLADRAPQVAVRLVELGLDGLGADDARREPLEASLATVQRLLNRFEEAEPVARRLRTHTADPDRAANMAWIEAYCRLGTARAPQALGVIAAALDDGATPRRWRARLQALRAVVLGAVGRYAEVPAAADAALHDGARAGDRYAVALALHAKAQSAAREDAPTALALIDQGLAAAPDGPDGTDLRLLLLSNRLTNLTVLDRADEAAGTARDVLALARRAGTARHAAVRVTVAQAHFAGGRWNDAMAELAPTGDLARELANNRPKLIVLHGLAALIAVHRDERRTAAEHLDAVRHIVITDGVRRRSADYLLLARAAVAERNSQRGQAIAALSPALDPDCARDVSRRHPVLPELIRLALAEADLDTVRAATACLDETADHQLPGRLAAVNHGHGLVTGDADLLSSAAAYYRSAGRPWELGQTQEDLAELLGRAGRTVAARAAFAEAVDAYRALGATWDIRRAEMRLREFGIRCGSRGRRPRPASGWPALTPTEVTIAKLVAEGLSNPDIAAMLVLSRRTVQTHISHILAKLRVRSRVDIAREVFAHGSGPSPPPS